jgi:hypothetical protein
MRLEDCNDNSSPITPQPGQNCWTAIDSSSLVKSTNCRVLDLLKIAWDLDDLNSEPEPSQPRGKKRKAGGHGGREAAHVDIEDKQ